MLPSVSDVSPSLRELESLIVKMEIGEEFHRNIAAARRCYAEARRQLRAPARPGRKVVASPRRGA
jgi:hypothetical protein